MPDGGRKRQRVLILQGTIPHYRRPVYNGLAAHFDVTVLHGGPATVTPDDRYREQIVPVRSIGPFRFVPGLAARAAGFDAVIAMFDLRWPSYLMPLLRRRRTGRWILWGHGYGRSAFGNLVRDRLLHRADAALLYAAAGAHEMEARGIDGGKLFVAENTVHVPNHQDFSGAAKGSLLFVGRLLPAKKVDVLIDAFRRVLPRIPADVRLHIVGDGEAKATLVAQAQAAGLADRINFHGTIHNDDELAGLFQSAYAYVSTGYLGLSVLHSFAYGVPVITGSEESHPPEVHNVKDGHNALVYADQAGLEQAMVDVCTQPELAARLGRNAYALYANERTLERMLDGFRRAIEGA